MCKIRYHFSRIKCTVTTSLYNKETTQNGVLTLCVYWKSVQQWVSNDDMHLWCSQAVCIETLETKLSCLWAFSYSLCQIRIIIHVNFRNGVDTDSPWRALYTPLEWVTQFTAGVTMVRSSSSREVNGKHFWLLSVISLASK